MLSPEANAAITEIIADNPSLFDLGYAPGNADGMSGQGTGDGIDAPSFVDQQLFESIQTPINDAKAFQEEVLLKAAPPAS